MAGGRKKSAQPKKVGRKSMYEEEWKDRLGLLTSWRRKGATHKQIAEKMGIGYSTLFEWIEKYSELADALKQSQQDFLGDIENAMAKKANGYDTWEEEWELNRETGKMEMVKRKRKHVDPHYGSQTFILKNRAPQEWKDDQRIQHEGSMNHNHQGTVGINVLNELSVEELRGLIKDGQGDNDGDEQEES